MVNILTITHACSNATFWDDLGRRNRGAPILTEGDLDRSTIDVPASDNISCNDQRETANEG